MNALELWSTLIGTLGLAFSVWCYFRRKSSTDLDRLVAGLPDEVRDNLIAFRSLRLERIRDMLAQRYGAGDARLVDPSDVLWVAYRAFVTMFKTNSTKKNSNWLKDLDDQIEAQVNSVPNLRSGVRVSWLVALFRRWFG